MTDLERLQQAKDCLLQLANGIDPVTGREAPPSDLINQVQISRCLFYAADVLRQVMESGGVSGKSVKAKKPPFDLPPDARAGLKCTDTPVTIGQIRQKLNDLVDLEQMQRMKSASLLSFLLQSGLLYRQVGSSGKERLLPTQDGRALGLSTETRTGQNGPHTVVTYSRAAQQLILDNLDSIIAINAQTHENQGKPWTPEQDAQLQQMAANGAEIQQLSEIFQRSRGAIRSRLEKLEMELDSRSTESEEHLPF